jgi:hypothetical protein
MMILTFILWGWGSNQQGLFKWTWPWEREIHIYIYYIYIFTYSCTYICTVAARKCKKTTALRNFEFMHWARRSPPRIIQRNKSLWNGKNTFTTDINWLRVFQCDLC